ncbi:MAG: PilZ domain-containing protein [Pyrinomonadaceae bacterium]
MLPIEPEETLTIQEKRSSERKKLIVDVRFEGGDTTGVANTRDIGVGGLYIATDTPLETGDVIFMEMTFGGERFAVQGTVAYVDTGVGIGVRFKDLTAENVATLKKELQIDQG